MRVRSGVVLTLTIALFLASCSSEVDPPGEGLTVVATTTILGDLVSQVVGDGASVEILMPIGADPHDFQASSAQVAAVSRADLVVANGLGLEEGLEDVLAGAGSDGVRILEVGPMLDPIRLREAGDEDDHGAEDPHVWFDPLRMARAAQLVADALDEIDPAGEWESQAAAYADQLRDADVRITELLAAVPAERRKLVTSHESLGYFAERYDFEVVGVVIPGGSTLSDPSSEELARLIETIRSEGVKAIFSETTQTSSLIDAVGSEVGEEIVIVDLYTESLGEPGSGAETLIDMLITNAERIAGALGA